MDADPAYESAHCVSPIILHIDKVPLDGWGTHEDALRAHSLFKRNFEKRVPANIGARVQASWRAALAQSGLD
jgi:hypothetical protein